MGIILDSLHTQHKQRQARIKAAAIKELTTPIPTPLPPVEEEIVPEIIETPEKKFVTSFDLIAYVVCEYYDVPFMDVISARRIPRVVKCRAVLAYELYKFTTYSGPQIGRKMNKDPTSIWYAVGKCKQNKDSFWKDELAQIESKIAPHIKMRGEMR